MDFLVPLWKRNLPGHGGEAHPKLTIFQVSGLENYKYITNTRLGAMECSDWRDLASVGGM